MDTQATERDDGRRYLLSVPREAGGVAGFLDKLRPHADHHTIAVYGSTDLARRLGEADRLGVCVAWRDITNENVTDVNDTNDTNDDAAEGSLSNTSEGWEM